MKEARFVYGDHALEQMRERHISQSVLEGAFEDPDSIVPARGGRHCLIKHVRKNLSLRIVFREGRGVLYIITAYFTDKKYEI